jgi:sugar phosphate isomerase/epimerase
MTPPAPPAPPAHTLTGSFPIGLRLTGPFAARPVAEAAAWAQARGFGCVDLHAVHLADLPRWREADLPVGTIDLFAREWDGMLSADAGRRRDTTALAAENLRRMAAAGVERAFVVMLAEDVNLPRRETFAHMVESYGGLHDVLHDTGIRLAIEGWPGCNAQCCTPESYRAFLREMNSAHYGINYDPSHLLRMGIDPLRFVREFAGHVVHVHGKDTWIDEERLYELGREQAGVFAAGLPWGGWFWRYTIPGAGITPWPEVLATLRDTGYRGYVSIELEDVDYNGTVAGEERGFLAARDFLAGM